MGRKVAALRQILITDAVIYRVFFNSLPKGRLIHITANDVTSAFVVSFELFDGPDYKEQLQNYTKIADHEEERADRNVIWSGDIPVDAGQSFRVTFDTCVIGDRVDVTALVELDD